MKESKGRGAGELVAVLERAFGTKVEVAVAADMPDVKALRYALELRQAEFAQLVGVAVPTVSRWESHKRKPKGLALSRLRTIEAEVALAGIMSSR